jgi:hypothetical protein
MSTNNKRIFTSMKGKYSSNPKPLLTIENMRAHNRSIVRNEYGYILLETREGNIEKRYIFPREVTYVGGDKGIIMSYDDDDNDAWSVTTLAQDYFVYHDDDSVAEMP